LTQAHKRPCHPRVNLLMNGLIYGLIVFYILIRAVLAVGQEGGTPQADRPPEPGVVALPDVKPEDFLQMKGLVRPVVVVREAGAPNLPQPALERSEGAEKGNLAEKPPDTQPQDYYFDVEAVKMKKAKKWLEFHGFVSMTDPLHGRDDPTQRKNVNFIDQTWITFWLGAHIYKTLSFTGEVDIENSFEVEADKGHFDWNVWGDRVSLRAGKFVYPFGIERLAYSAPFNKLVDRPSPSVRIIPGTYSDVGLQLYGTLRPPHVHSLKYELAVTNGLDNFNKEGKQEDLQDNNSNKQLGGRLALAPLSWIEIGGSYLTGKYDRHNRHGLYLAGADLRLQRGGLELRGEYVTGRVEAVGGDFSRHGYYLQTSYHHPLEWNYLHYIEGVIRYDSVNPRDDKLDGLHADRLAFGLNFSPRQHIDIKLEYEKNLQSRGGEDNVFIQAIFRW